MKNNSKGIITVEDLSVTLNGITIFHPTAFSIPSGVRCAIMGPNGAGKTTLLKTMIGEIKPVSGRTLFWDMQILKCYKDIAVVHQQKDVDWNFPITAFDLVCMGVREYFNGIFVSSYVREKAREALRIVAMEEISEKQINELSGGEKQRVFIARAFAQEPKLLLLDEPFAGIDVFSERIIANYLKNFVDDGNAVVSVHHDLYTACDYFDWVIIVNKGIRYVGPLSEAVIKEYFFHVY